MRNSRALSRSPTSSGGEPRPTGGRGWVFARLLSLILLASSLLAPVAARSEKAASPEPRMVVEARELVYDETKNTVSARGNVQIYYKGRLLEADRVTYDRTSGRLRAEGNARLTEPDGAVERAESFDLTDDFKNGFIESLQADTANNTHFGAPHAERRGDANGQETIFDYGTYTACDACKDDPSRPRLWQIHAKRIIHDGVEKMIYYEDATLEFLDIPVAYMPYWSSPDPTVKRKSGLLDADRNLRQLRRIRFRRPDLLGDLARQGSDRHADLFHEAGPAPQGRVPTAFRDGLLRHPGGGDEAERSRRPSPRRPMAPRISNTAAPWRAGASSIPTTIGSSDGT